MAGRYSIAGPVILAAALLTSACTSRADKAASAAAIAADALQQGQIAVARQQINKALAARDDIGDYWLLSAHIALAEQNYGGAFDAYESVAIFDRSNVEALTRLCQIALSADQPDRAERYADQLLVLHPGDKAATTVKAALAFQQGDKRGAAALLDKVFAADPADTMALIVKSKLLAANDDYVGAARAAEASLASPGDPSGRLNVLKDVYLKAKDADGYRRTIARLARAYPDMASAQLDYAASLYDTGDPASALAVTRRTLTLRPDDVATANAVLNLWMAQGAAAMPVGTIVANAANAPLEARAAYAQYATAIGHPELALSVLGDAAAQEPASVANADAKAARAYAQARLGMNAAADAQIAAVLAADRDQPRALAARGWIRARAGDRIGAIEDLRHALAGDPDNASTRLTLADLQLAQGDGVLAAATLQEGLGNAGADPRIASRLVALLRSQGRTPEATGVLEAYARAHPFGRQPRG